MKNITWEQISKERDHRLALNNPHLWPDGALCLKKRLSGGGWIFAHVFVKDREMILVEENSRFPNFKKTSAEKLLREGWVVD